MIYLLSGTDDFGIQLSLSEILKKLNGRVIRMKETSLNSFSNEALTESFFDNEKVIIVEYLLEKSLKEKQETELKRVIEKISQETSVIFIEKSAPNASLRKLLGDKASISDHSRPVAKDLMNYVRNRSHELGADISPLAAERFITYVGPNYWQIEEELKKLSLYVKDRDIEQVIEIGDVDEIVHSNFEANIFELMDAISQKNINRAITLLGSFLDSGENELYILTMIARQFRNIAMAKIDNVVDETAFAKKAGLHPYVAKKSIMQARNFSVGEVGEIYQKIIAADLNLKSGQNPKQVLQSIILN
jgi:DNA polymerase-3 subunit delta